MLFCGPQDPSASEPEDSVFWACCKPTPLVPAKWTITPELVLAVCDDLTTSTPQEIAGTDHFSAFYPFLAGCGGLARRLCGHQIEFGASLRPHLGRKLGRPALPQRALSFCV